MRSVPSPQEVCHVVVEALGRLLALVKLVERGRHSLDLLLGRTTEASDGAHEALGRVAVESSALGERSRLEKLGRVQIAVENRIGRWVHFATTACQRRAFRLGVAGEEAF